MKVRILGSAVEASPDVQYVSTYVINDTIAIDAGALGVNGTPAQQTTVRHVLLTHSHLDHIATLPVFIENTFEAGRDGVTIYGHADSLAALHKHVFNDVMWPDFVRLSQPGQQFVRLCPLEAEVPIRIDGLSITPVAVDHVVVTYGYIVSDGVSTVVFGADSGPTERIWELATMTPPPRSVFLESSFPSAMRGLACVSRHLTPELIEVELAKMPEMKMIVAIHIKAKHRDETVRELLGLKIPNLVIGVANSDYHL